MIKEIEDFDGLEALRLEGNTVGVEAARVIAKALEKKSELKVRSGASRPILVGDRPLLTHHPPGRCLGPVLPGPWGGHLGAQRRPGPLCPCDVSARAQQSQTGRRCQEDKRFTGSREKGKKERAELERACSWCRRSRSCSDRCSVQHQQRLPLGGGRFGAEMAHPSAQVLVVGRLLTGGLLAALLTAEWLVLSRRLDASGAVP